MHIQARSALGLSFLPALALVASLLPSCSSGSGGGSPVTPPLAPSDESVAAALNDAILLPPGAFMLTPTGTDASVTVTTSSVSSIDLVPGQPNSTSFAFVSALGNVNGAAIGFGTSTTPPTQVMVVPVDTGGSTSGTLTVDFSLSDTVCSNLSQICHDLRCYEYAVVDGMQLSAANVAEVALGCGACDEPSCQRVLVECGGGGTDPIGQGTFAYSNGSSSGSTMITAGVLQTGFDFTQACGSPGYLLISSAGVNASAPNTAWAVALAVNTPASLTAGSYSFAGPCGAAGHAAPGVDIDTDQPISGSFVISGVSGSSISGNYTFTGVNELGGPDVTVTGTFTNVPITLN